MRGLAILIMIECHTFNSFTRLDLRDGGPYILTQFIGGMAAPLFLFMAGMTMAFQMESLDRREPDRLRRWRTSLWWSWARAMPSSPSPAPMATPQPASLVTRH